MRGSWRSKNIERFIHNGWTPVREGRGAWIVPPAVLGVLLSRAVPEKLCLNDQLSMGGESSTASHIPAVSDTKEEPGLCLVFFACGTRTRTMRLKAQAQFRRIDLLQQNLVYVPAESAEVVSLTQLLFLYTSSCPFPLRSCPHHVHAYTHVHAATCASPRGATLNMQHPSILIHHLRAPQIPEIAPSRRECQKDPLHSFWYMTPKDKLSSPKFSIGRIN